MGGGGNLIPLAKGSVLYLGSAVPLETSVGLEALQRPLRDRYLTGDPGQKVSGIDAVLTVFSGGLLMQYPGDDSSSTWFPMQTLHMCAAVKAAGGTFVSLDSPQSLGSCEPPIFAVIARRSRGVKVLECHVFVCRSTEAALGFVQSCTHAFQHREGWTDGCVAPVSSASARIVAAAECAPGPGDLARTSLQGFMYSQDQPTRMYNISGMEPPRPAAPPPAAPAPAPAPPPVQVIQQQQQQPAVQVIQQQQQQPSAGVQYITMNPPGAPVPQMVPQISMQVPQISMGPMQVPQISMGPMQVPQIPRGPQMMAPQGYFADWDQNYGMTMMVVPGSPFNPGASEARSKENTKTKKKHKKHKKKNKKKSKKYEEQEEDDDEEEEEEEMFYIRRSRLPQGQLPPDFVEVQSHAQSGINSRYSTGGQSEVRYVSEPVRPVPPPNATTEIHYVPIPNSSSSYQDDFPPSDPTERNGTTDIFLAKVPDRTAPRAGYYYFEDQGPPEFQPGGGGGGYDPYAYRVQPQDFDYDYGRDYDAARQQQQQQQQGPGSRQGIYDMRLPRTNFEVQYDERGFDGMADRLGYFP